jgi:hypothetical protein
MEALEQFRAAYGGLSSAEVRRLIKEDKTFKHNLVALYRTTFHKPLNTDCGNCWLDAFVLLIRTSKQKLKEMKERRFELKAGALLVDVVKGDNALMATHHNLTDELALYHLRTNPKCIKLFSRYPADWEQLIKESTEEQTKPKARRRSKK